MHVPAGTAARRAGDVYDTPVLLDAEDELELLKPDTPDD
jgi:hypothetical protein